MSDIILFVAATAIEADALSGVRGIVVNPDGYVFGNLRIKILVAGIGSHSTAWELQKWISANEKPRLIVNIGIAGSYRDDIRVGDVVMPLTDCFADSGIEDGTNFLTLFEAGLSLADDFPFSGGVIKTGSKEENILKPAVRSVNAITVNTATGSDITRAKLVSKFNPDIETMEGATFFYICSRAGIPFLALRAISNMVETRNRKKWDIKLALDNLADKLNEVFLILER